MIAVLAGRRIDAESADKKRFPLAQKDRVYEEIYNFLRRRKIAILVSSAACGADLLAQKAAAKLGIEPQIILPFDRQKFLKTSVNDRPGDWEKIFDEICDEAEDKGNLIILKGYKDEESAYSAVTEKLFSRSQKLASPNEKIIAIAVWEGDSRDKDDETASFVRQAENLKYELKEFSTLP